MKVQIPPSRIFLSSKPVTCKIKTNFELVQPDQEKFEGGFLHKADKTQKIFVVVPSETENEISHTYKAKKPMLAAVKAYYGYFRRNRTLHQNVTMKENDEDHTIIDNIEQNVKQLLEKHNLSNLLEPYMKRVKETHFPVDNKQVIRLRRVDKNQIKVYEVQYKRIDSPNIHEIKKLITKVAVAKSM